MKVLVIYYESSFVNSSLNILTSTWIYSLKVKSSLLSEQTLLLIETKIFTFIVFNGIMLSFAFL